MGKLANVFLGQLIDHNVGHMNWVYRFDRSVELHTNTFRYNHVTTTSINETWSC